MSLPRKLSKYKQAHLKTIQNSIEYPIYVFPKQQKKKNLLKVLIIYLQLLKVLRLTMSSLNGPSVLQKLVSKCRLTMINMSYNVKIPIQQKYTYVEPSKST